MHTATDTALTSADSDCQDVAHRPCERVIMGSWQTRGSRWSSGSWGRWRRGDTGAPWRSGACASVPVAGLRSSANASRARSIAISMRGSTTASAPNWWPGAPPYRHGVPGQAREPPRTREHAPRHAAAQPRGHRQLHVAAWGSAVGPCAESGRAPVAGGRQQRSFVQLRARRATGRADADGRRLRRSRAAVLDRRFAARRGRQQGAGFRRARRPDVGPPHPAGARSALAHDTSD